MKNGITAALAKLTEHNPQYNYAVVFDTTWHPFMPPVGECWDYDPFITRVAAEERMTEPHSERFSAPELWAHRGDDWERIA